MVQPDPDVIEALLARAWQIPPSRRELFVRAECAGDEALAEAVLMRLDSGNTAGSSGSFDPDATIDLPAGVDLEGTIDLPGGGGSDATVDLPGDETLGVTVDLPVDDRGSTGSTGPKSDSAAPAASKGSEVPSQIADFRIKDILGSGGMGDVYLAEQLHPRREVALKVIRSKFISNDALRRFEVESHTLARLSHPGIAQVFAAGIHEEGEQEIPFFAMEYVMSGLPLTEWADEQELDTVERLRLFERVCRAVAHGHQRGVMHLDLKPGNILVNAEGRAKVIDFGVAKMEGDQSAEGKGQIVGTLQYMPPEQVRGDAHVDISCDVYALGVVLYQLVAGELPYEIDTTSIRAASTSVLNAPPPALFRIRPDLGPDLDAIVRKALAKDPADRYHSASELGADIGRFLADEPISARQQTNVEAVRRFVRRNRAAATAIIFITLAIVVSLVAVSVFAYRTEKARSEEQRQRLIADRALELANAERKRLFKITLFQSDMIKNLEPVVMGESLRTIWLERVRSRMTQTDRSPEEIDELILEQERLLENINPTDIAVELIDTQILRRALLRAPDWFAGEPELEADLHEIIADAYEQIGLYNEASPEYLKALEIRTREFGPDHPRTLESMSDLGLLRLAQGELEEASELLEAALEGRRKAYGDSDPETIGSLQNLGQVLYEKGDLAGAESVWKEALEISERVNDPDDPVTATLVSNFGTLYLELGRLDEAEVFLQKDADYSIRMNGPLDPGSLEAKLNLGVLAFRKGDLDAAVILFREVVDGYRRTLGEQHPQTLLSMVNLGTLLLQQGDSAEAAKLLESAYLARRSALGDEHPDTFLALQLVAEAYLFSGDMSGAAIYVDGAADRFLGLYGPEDPRSVTWQFRLGLVQMDAGSYTEAEATFLALVEACGSSEALSQQPICASLPNVLNDMYLAWHDREPGVGHDRSAADWKAIVGE